MQVFFILYIYLHAISVWKKITQINAFICHEITETHKGYYTVYSLQTIKWRTHTNQVFLYESHAFRRALRQSTLKITVWEGRGLTFISSVSTRSQTQAVSIFPTAFWRALREISLEMSPPPVLFFWHPFSPSPHCLQQQKQSLGKHLFCIFGTSQSSTFWSACKFSQPDNQRNGCHL